MPECKLQFTLRLGTNVEYRIISHLFGVGLPLGVLLDMKSVRQLLHFATDVSEYAGEWYAASCGWFHEQVAISTGALDGIHIIELAENHAQGLYALIEGFSHCCDVNLYGLLVQAHGYLHPMV